MCAHTTPICESQQPLLGLTLHFLAFAASSSRQEGPKVRSGAGSGPSPHSTFTLKPEPQEVVLRSILSGQTNYSPFEKCTFLSSPTFPSSACTPSSSSSPHELFLFQVLQRGTVEETQRSATCVISKWAAFRLESSCCRCGRSGP